jgi:hypothetical protein
MWIRSCFGQHVANGRRLPGVDIEPEDGIDLHRLVAAQDRTELPLGKRGHNPGRSLRILGLEYLSVANRTSAVEKAGNHDAAAEDSNWKIRVQGIGGSQVFCIRMRRGGGIRILHYGRAGNGIDINRINPVTFERAVKIECTSRSGGGNNRDVRAAMVLSHGRAPRRI